MTSTDDLALKATRFLTFNVVDEQKIVNYRLLSRALGVHVSQAKKLMESFYHSKKDSFDLHVSYILTGTTSMDGSAEYRDEVSVLQPNSAAEKEKFVPSIGIPSATVMIVSGKRLEEKRKLFSTLNSEHIYSIQLSPIKNSSVLCTANIELAKRFPLEKSKLDKECQLYGTLKARPNLSAALEAGGKQSSRSTVSKKPSTHTVPISKEPTRSLNNNSSSSSSSIKNSSKNNSKPNSKSTTPLENTQKSTQQSVSKPKSTSETTSEPRTASTPYRSSKTNAQPKKSSGSILSALSESAKKNPVREKVVIADVDADEDEPMADAEEEQRRIDLKEQEKTKKEEQEKLQSLFDDDDDDDLEMEDPDVEVADIQDKSELPKQEETTAEPEEPRTADLEEMMEDASEDHIDTSILDSEPNEPPAANPPTKKVKMVHEVDEDGFTITTIEKEPPKPRTPISRPSSMSSTPANRPNSATKNASTGKKKKGNTNQMSVLSFFGKK